MTQIISNELVLAQPPDGVNWLFEIGLIKISSKGVALSYNGDLYDARILPESFSGVTMRWDVSGSGLIAPNDMTFEVSNHDNTYTTSSFEGLACKLTLVVDFTEIRIWRFKIKRAVSYYGKIKCYCVDFLHDHLEGDYPNTPNPKEVWASGDIDEEGADDYCIPVVLGVAYVPVRSVNTGLQRYYVLGESGPAYTVHEVMSPHSWPSSVTWDVGSYTMSGSVSEGYQLLQPIIADSTGDGTPDAPGLWRSGDRFYDMLCRYSRSDTVSITSPADWIEYLLKDFGVASADIDAVSFLAAKNQYISQTVGFDGGGFFKKENREQILSNILKQVDSFLVCTDKVELHQFSKTAVETIDNVLLMSFSPEQITRHVHDSGRVHWPEAYDKPHDVLNGKAIVPLYDGGSKGKPSADILQCRFLCGANINAQIAGILHFQKAFSQTQRVSFGVIFDSITNKGSLCPGQVVTVNNTLYGGAYNILVTEIHFGKELQLQISGVVLEHLEEWADMAPADITITPVDTGGWELSSTDYNGNLNSDWSHLLDIPQRFKDTAALGLNVTQSYMGYFDGTVFQSYIDSNGDFQFRGDANQYINWNGTTLTVSGSITVRNPSDVRTALNVANGADATATIISGGLITTGTITVAQGGSVTAGMTGAGSGDNSVRFWAGHTTPASGIFRVTQGGALTATSATITGAITATSGSFTGTITATSGSIANAVTVAGTAASTVASNASTGAAHAGTAHAASDADKTHTIITGGLVTTGRLEVQNNSNVTGAGITGGGTATTDVRIWAGNTYANRTSAAFRVTHAGALTATSATITGTITATSGSIANTVTVGGTAASTVASNASTGAAHAGFDHAPSDADATATTISGGLITTGTLQVVQGGSSTAGITGNTSGDTAVRIWAGGTFANRATAPFRVTQGGALTATNATLTGSLTVNGTSGITVNNAGDINLQGTAAVASGSLLFKDGASTKVTIGANNSSYMGIWPATSGTGALVIGGIPQSSSGYSALPFSTITSVSSGSVVLHAGDPMVAKLFVSSMAYTGGFFSLTSANGHYGIHSTSTTVNLMAGNADRLSVSSSLVTFNVPINLGDSNLSNYAEGTWTPGIAFGGNAVGVTYVAQTGYYTRIGNIVHVSAWLYVNSKGTSTGSVTLTGLPFTIANDNAARTGISIGVIQGITFADFVTGFGIINTKTIELRETTNAGVHSNLTNADFGSNPRIAFGITYRVA